MDHERPAILETVVAPPERSIADAISQLDMAGTGGLVLCGPDGRVAGLLTDGDLRRAVLRKVSLADPCGSIATQDPVVARAPIGPADALQLMVEHDINHLPVVDEAGVLIDFLLRKNIVVDLPGDLSAIVMAGGFGTRLMPLTETVPKPMLPVGERPLLERTIDQLRVAGIRDVHLTTHYLPDSRWALRAASASSRVPAGRSS
jgi:CBS domain-containing protein